MVSEQTLRRGKRAARLAFFIAGFGLACWAPLVPYAQQRMQADSAMLGTIMLGLGLGAVIGMPGAGALTGRFGSRWVIAGGALGLMVALPLLATLAQPIWLALCLVLLGMGAGAIDVAANIHGAEVQRTAGVPLMSGFHGLYSIGGLAGVSSMTTVIALGMDVVLATGLAALVILLCMAAALPGLRTARGVARQPVLALPRGKILMIGLLMLVVFLVEGAMLDWGALLLTQIKQVEVAMSGVAYTVFALAMTFSRLAGDRVVYQVGETPILYVGMLVTGIGILLAALAQPLALILAGIGLAGLATGNVVPVLFTLAGRQKTMPTSQAIAAASILGYLGVLMGPALMGYAAHFIGLGPAFAALGLLMLLAVAVLPAVVMKGGMMRSRILRNL